MDLETSKESSFKSLLSTDFLILTFLKGFIDSLVSIYSLSLVSSSKFLLTLLKILTIDDLSSL